MNSSTEITATEGGPNPEVTILKERIRALTGDSVVDLIEWLSLSKSLESIQRIQSAAPVDDGQRYVQLTQDGDCSVLAKRATQIKRKDASVDLTVFRQPNTLCAMTLSRFPQAEAQAKAAEYPNSNRASLVMIKMVTGLPRRRRKTAADTLPNSGHSDDSALRA